jgi:hypothetical protein
MNTENINNVSHAIIKPIRGGKSMFVNTADDVAMQSVRDRYNNQDLLISVCRLTKPDTSTPRTYPLYFIVTHNNLEECRISALEVCSYIEGNYGVPEDCIELIYNDGGTDEKTITGDNTVADENINEADGVSIATNNCQDTTKNAGTYNGIDKTGGAVIFSRSQSNVTARYSNQNDAVNAEMIITVPPIVFGGQPTPLTPALNYYLARRMVKDGIRNVDIDIYSRDYFIRLPNSLNTTVERFVISLSTKELLYLDAGAIFELSKKPRSEDSFIIPRRVPEAAEWLAQVLDECEKQRQRQEQLRKRLLSDGWQIPPCIRRLPVGGPL